ncbi:MAG: hypothetical protein EZS28_000071 [Streblomastix strix]|uniref:Uncharacterized protein n=1 Tax=Streblomastix strix TaxID=222440 RepID=A0A5J4XBV0_9EUKA|nr:MAG: hypothetical protein EZS28_000071 [Streblomastix strix]
MSQTTQGYFGKTAYGIESSEYLQFWIGFSTACISFYQFQLMKDATAIWGSAIFAREQAVISGNSLRGIYTKNSVSESILESIIEGKRYCGIFIDIPLCEIDRQVTVQTTGIPFNYKIPFDFTFRWDFLQDQKAVSLNKNDTIMNNHLAYHMIPPEKPEIVYLLAGEDSNGLEQQRYNVRINQNNFKQFIGTGAYPDPTKASITTMMHYLCDAFVRIIFDDSSIPQILNIDVIGELAGGAIKPQ